ncbi:MAG: hypothetical protein IPK53_08410, partial [bacterium]|nr:hypothetical protein [bacterium]
MRSFLAQYPVPAGLGKLPRAGLPGRPRLRPDRVTVAPLDAVQLGDSSTTTWTTCPILAAKPPMSSSGSWPGAEVETPTAWLYGGGGAEA